MTVLTDWCPAYFDGWKRAFDYQSRSKRLNYWSFVITNTFVQLSLQLVQGLLEQVRGYFYPAFFFSPQTSFGSLPIVGDLIGVAVQLISIFTLFFLFGVLLSSISLNVRRLRDIGKSPYWAFLTLLPLVGFVFSLVWFTRPSHSRVTSNLSS